MEASQRPQTSCITSRLPQAGGSEQRRAGIRGKTSCEAAADHSMLPTQNVLRKLIGSVQPSLARRAEDGRGRVWGGDRGGTGGSLRVGSACARQWRREVLRDRVQERRPRVHRRSWPRPSRRGVMASGGRGLSGVKQRPVTRQVSVRCIRPLYVHVQPLGLLVYGSRGVGGWRRGGSA